MHLYPYCDEAKRISAKGCGMVKKRARYQGKDIAITYWKVMMRHRDEEYTSKEIVKRNCSDGERDSRNRQRRRYDAGVWISLLFDLFISFVLHLCLWHRMEFFVNINRPLEIGCSLSEWPHFRVR